MSLLLGPQFIGRYREIVSILARHGFGWLVAELNLRNLLPLNQRLGQLAEDEPGIQAIHLRLAFEELGATFIKLGQILSTRSDMLPPEYITELAKLQDAAPLVSIHQLVTVFEDALGAPPEEVFREFDSTPIAAASIGQVHAACLPNGEEVVVKVQRPGVAEAIARDLNILLDLADLVTQHTAFGRQYDVRELMQEFAFNLGCELDYSREGKNADQFRQAFASDPDIHIPKIHWDYTTERVIVMERLSGFKVNDLPALDTAGIDRKRLANNSVRLMLEEMFVHGFFHADPHPGNLYILPDGRIGIIDFGMMGRLDENLQEALTRMLLALSKGDSTRMIDEMLTLGIVQGEVNRQVLKRDLDHLIICYATQSAQQMAAANVFNELTGLARRHHLRLPAELVLMAKVMAISEGIGLQLDPDFQFIPFAQPYLQRYWLQRRSPAHIGEKVAEGVIDVAEFGLTFPRRLTRLAAQLERGELGTQVNVRGLDMAQERMQRMVNQLSASILVGALIVGLSQFMHMVAPEGFVQEYAGRFFGFLFVIAVILGFWLLVSIVRSLSYR